MSQVRKSAALALACALLLSAGPALAAAPAPAAPPPARAEDPNTLDMGVRRPSSREAGDPIAHAAPSGGVAETSMAPLPVSPTAQAAAEAAAKPMDNAQTLRMIGIGVAIAAAFAVVVALLGRRRREPGRFGDLK